MDPILFIQFNLLSNHIFFSQRKTFGPSSSVLFEKQKQKAFLKTREGRAELCLGRGEIEQASYWKRTGLVLDARRPVGAKSSLSCAKMPRDDLEHAAGEDVFDDSYEEQSSQSANASFEDQSSCV